MQSFYSPCYWIVIRRWIFPSFGAKIDSMTYISSFTEGYGAIGYCNLWESSRWSRSTVSGLKVDLLFFSALRIFHNFPTLKGKNIRPCYPNFFIEWLGSETSPLQARWIPEMATWSAVETDRIQPQVPWNKPKRRGREPWLCTTLSRTGRTASLSTGRSSYSRRTTSLGNTQGESLSGHILPR